jgi:hypothetical protein
MESELTPVLRNNLCSRLFKRVFMVKTVGQFRCGSQISNRSPWLCSAKIESTSPIASIRECYRRLDVAGVYRLRCTPFVLQLRGR